MHSNLREKTLNPDLVRNVKFYDTDLYLVMDFKVSPTSDWKSVFYDQAKEILKKTRVRTESFTIEELETMADIAPRDMKKRQRETLLDSESEDILDSTIIHLTDNADSNEGNKQIKPSCKRLCFINTNARSLKPKVRSFYDCFAEKTRLCCSYGNLVPEQ